MHSPRVLATFSNNSPRVDVERQQRPKVRLGLSEPLAVNGMYRTEPLFAESAGTASWGMRVIPTPAATSWRSVSRLVAL